MIDIAIVGSGPAGIDAAREAVKYGLTATLVGAMPPGGRAAMGSLLPSKVWLHEATRASAGTAVAPAAADAITEEIRRTQGSWTSALAGELEQLGVTFYRGTARLASSDTITVHSPEDASVMDTIQARSILLTTGSEPSFTPTVRPDGDRIIAPRHTQKLTEIPKHIVFTGGGVTGTEYASAFARLGSTVEIFTRGDTLLRRGEPAAAGFLTDYLENELGVVIHRNQTVTYVSRKNGRVITTSDVGTSVESDYAFIATGRHPDLSIIENAGAGLSDSFERDENSRLRTDEFGQTSIAGIYVAGDAAGGILIANKATWEARRAVRHIAGDDVRTLPEATWAVEAVYTDPQAAWVGDVQRLPAEETPEIGIHERSYNRLLLAHIDHAEQGFFKVWYEKGSGAILGASAAGSHAAELLTPVQMAMHQGLSVGRLNAIPAPHPTFSELVTH